MIKEYLLLRYKTFKKTYEVVDRVTVAGLREARMDFENRNNFKKLLVKGDLIITKVEKYY